MKKAPALCQSPYKKLRRLSEDARPIKPIFGFCSD